MNKVILMGRLTRDPEVRYSQSAEPVAVTRYGIAINRRFKRQGEPEVDFFDCVTFGKSAEVAGRYLKKGMMVTLSGRLQNSSWDDQQTGQKRWKTEVIVDDFEFAESKSAFEARQGAAPYPSAAESGYLPEQVPPGANGAPPPQASSDFSVIPGGIEDDDLPF